MRFVVVLAIATARHPVKPLLRAIENLDIASIEAALTEIAARFAIDLSKLDGPAGSARPIR